VKPEMSKYYPGKPLWPVRNFSGSTSHGLSARSENYHLDFCGPSYTSLLRYRIAAAHSVSRTFTLLCLPSSAGLAPRLFIKISACARSSWFSSDKSFSGSTGRSRALHRFRSAATSVSNTSPEAQNGADKRSAFRIPQRLQFALRIGSDAVRASTAAAPRNLPA